VQEAIIDKKDEWCTPDLLTKIAGNETLRKAFESPDYKQKHPKESVKQYGSNPSLSGYSLFNISINTFTTILISAIIDL
jgi:hypothetical protein